MIANFFIGAGSGLIFSLVTTMLVEYKPERSASLVALNSLGRSLFACVGGTVTQPLLSAIGNGWLFTGLGFIAASCSLVIIANRKRGQRWRESIAADTGGTLKQGATRPRNPRNGDESI